jgi:hypothetical protein
VVITPFETLRTRQLAESAMYRLPAESTATPSGPQLGAGGWAVVASETQSAVPRSDGQDTRYRVQSQDDELISIREKDIARLIDRNRTADVTGMLTGASPQARDSEWPSRAVILF